jgi:nitrite reductase/ring-hydroxylating ferredoxin subunit
MSDFIEIAATNEVPLGRAKAFNAGGRIIALYHTANGFFATDNSCPHRGGPLAEGDVLGGEIVCPWHFWAFDVMTGMCVGNPEISVATHELRVDGDRVMVKVAS